MSWSCGWRRSSICPGSCAGRRGWSSNTGLAGRCPRAPGWRGREVGWPGTRGTSGLIDRFGSGSGRVHSGASRWNRTGWTWGRGCGCRGSMAVKDREKNIISYAKLLSCNNWLVQVKPTFSCVTSYLQMPPVTAHIWYQNSGAEEAAPSMTFSQPTRPPVPCRLALPSLQRPGLRFTLLFNLVSPGYSPARWPSHSLSCAERKISSSSHTHTKSKKNFKFWLSAFPCACLSYIIILGSQGYFAASVLRAIRAHTHWFFITFVI